MAHASEGVQINAQAIPRYFPLRAEVGSAGHILFWSLWNEKS